jgi:hypothetical protein
MNCSENVNLLFEKFTDLPNIQRIRIEFTKKNVNQLLPIRHICAAYIGKFLENSVLKILQFCFLKVVRRCIGLNFRKSKVINPLRGPGGRP